MSPVYEEDGKWWFDTSMDGIMGPYDDKDIATEAYYKYMKTNCPSCEE